MLLAMFGMRLLPFVPMSFVDDAAACSGKRSDGWRGFRAMTPSRTPGRTAAAADGAGPAAVACGGTPRFFLSATHKSSGKTTIAVGLAAAFAARGTSVQTFKKGPDYIDPMWHTRVTGRAVLQPRLQYAEPRRDHRHLCPTRAGRENWPWSRATTAFTTASTSKGGDSSAAMAKVLQAPVVLVVDATGVMRGIAPLVLGYAAFDPDVTIAGLILNKVGNARQEAKLRRAIERYTDIPVIGAIGRDAGLTLNERHLGLATPAESERAEQALAAIRRTVADALDLDRLLALAREAPDLPAVSAPASRGGAPADVRIAVARDSAFSFYYPDDLAALERAGAQSVLFRHPCWTPACPRPTVCSSAAVFRRRMRIGCRPMRKCARRFATPFGTDCRPMRNAAG